MWLQTTYVYASHSLCRSEVQARPAGEGQGLTGWSRGASQDRTLTWDSGSSSEITQAVGRIQILAFLFPLWWKPGVTLSKQRLPRGPPHRALSLRGSWRCLQSQPGPQSAVVSCAMWLIKGVTIPPESQESLTLRSREYTSQWESCLPHPQALLSLVRDWL